MDIWKTYAEQYEYHTVVGDLKIADDVYSPQLHNRRRIFVLLPPSYASDFGRRYPVIYMQDGQNLFDEPRSYAGEWRVDETIELLAREGLEAIVVGVANMELRRIDEYGPFVDRRLRRGGRGDWYVAFLADTLKPLIDRDFRTMPAREHTGVLGSSMGGLISLYAFFSRPDVFGFAGALSPSLWFGHEAIFSYVQQAACKPGRIYLDLGTHEGNDTQAANQPPHKYISRYLTAARRMRAMLVAKGYAAGSQLCYQEEEEAAHNEAAWARRLPDALRFLLAPYQRAPQIALAPAGRAPEEPWWEF